MHNIGKDDTILQVIDAYLKPKCHSADSDFVLKAHSQYPFQRTKLHHICAVYFEWPSERTVCSSGGAHMQEGSLSFMQMAKISSTLYNNQINQKLLNVAILISPTASGVTTSFGMLGDIIIVEPKSYLAFAGKRVIEKMLNKEVPEGSQSAEVFCFEKGLLDSIVSRDSLKHFLSELFKFHGCFPWIENEN
ncbi:hypothetical protein RYX36_008616 [Vicia faba]